MRVAYLWPSGEVRSNCYASAFAALDPPTTIAKSSNNGDLFVTEASLLLSAPDSVECFDPARITEKMLDRLKAEFDVVFIRGANTLSNEVYAGILADFLEKIRMPVVCMGIGIQAPSKKRMPKGKDVLRLAHLLGDRSESVGVRGEVTAEFMNGLGVSNLRVIGCPSILRHNNPELRLKKPLWSELHSFGFSLTRYHSHLYQRDGTTFLKLQSRLIKELNRIGRVGVITQVEKEEKAFAYRYPAELRIAEERLRSDGWFDNEMEEIYKTRSVFFGTRATDYDMHVRNFDVIYGTRLHANAMAVACGIPAITFTFDLRVQEIYDFWRLPYLEVEAALELTPEAIYEGADFQPFNSRIGFIYHNFREYLESNRIPHRMQKS